jgi:hypothetical protein
MRKKAREALLYREKLYNTTYLRKSVHRSNIREAPAGISTAPGSRPLLSEIALNYAESERMTG